MESNIARVLLNTNGEDSKQNNIILPNFQFEPSVMVDMFPGPALLVDSDMAVKHHNVFAKSLLAPLQDREVLLTSMVSRCLSNNCPDNQKATLDDSNGLRHYDLYAFPLQKKSDQDIPIVFLFGRETTIEHNLTNALVESRQMFKDLVSCSTDFAWETDINGNFIYVSPKGILGYTAFELNGKNSKELIIGAEEQNPFDTMDKVNEMELWLKRSDGSMACLLVSAVPVLDHRAKWQGARGVCRDITHIREREAVLRRTHKREHVLNRILSSIRDMVTPSDMLKNALKSTMDGVTSEACFIIQKNNSPDGSFTAEVKQQGGDLAETDLIFTICQKAVVKWQNETDTKNKTSTFEIGSHQILMGITRHHAIDNGAIILIRNKENPWHEDELHLFNGITNHLGIAIQQAITHEELEKLASTDELTNMLNRRAFYQEIKKRLSNQKRSHKEGALLYIDLDNFKNVNDSKGHAVGDQVLRELSHIIKDNIRVGDYSARLGGDEFAVWLDETSEKDAQIKAHQFVVAGSQLARIADVSGPQPSLSIGVAISKPDQNIRLDDLIENADSALYQAKEAGKASYVLYDAKMVSTTDKNPEEISDQPILKEGDTYA